MKLQKAEDKKFLILPANNMHCASFIYSVSRDPLSNSTMVQKIRKCKGLPAPPLLGIGPWNFARLGVLLDCNDAKILGAPNRKLWEIFGAPNIFYSPISQKLILGPLNFISIFGRRYKNASLCRFMGKFISAILQKNAKKRYQNYTLKSQKKIRPPGNCYMGSGSATVSEGFQTGYIVGFSQV